MGPSLFHMWQQMPGILLEVLCGKQEILVVGTASGFKGETELYPSSVRTGFNALQQSHGFHTCCVQGNVTSIKHDFSSEGFHQGKKKIGAKRRQDMKPCFVMSLGLHFHPVLGQLQIVAVLVVW